MSNGNSSETDANRSLKGGRKRMLWTLFLILPATFIFTAAHRSADAVPCRALEIEVDQMDGMYFVDAPTLHSLVTERFELMDRPMSSLPLSDIHATLMNQHGVADCQIEPRLGGTLRIQIRQQRPIARIWLPGTAVYLDEQGATMPLSSKYTADVAIVHAPDLHFAKTVIPLLQKMDASPFWNRFIDQIEVDTDGLITFRPRIGDVVVELGSSSSLAQDLDKQLNQLRTFYTELIRRGDLRQYRSIRLQYDGQVVAAR